MSDSPTSSPLSGSAPAPLPGARSEADLLGKRGMLADRPDPRGFTKPTAVVRDPWAWAKPVRLTGWLERQDFHPVLLAILVPVVAFFIYQLIGALAVAAMVIPGAVSDAQSGAAPDVAEVMTQLTERADLAELIEQGQVRIPADSEHRADDLQRRCRPRCIHRLAPGDAAQARDA